MELIITDVNGWSKDLEITKAITRLGNASYVDIQIPSKEIAPLQLQILSNPELPTGCRVINMADQLTVYSDGRPTLLLPYSKKVCNPNPNAYSNKDPNSDDHSYVYSYPNADFN